uniref:Uncharacterized protein n=1 Tax=Fusarium oxysporum (strain Fo5176) TaxID=660025 RepID=A0A0D2XRW5_FUSOF
MGRPQRATVRRRWGAHANRVVSVAFSPDGQRLASATHDGFIKIWDARMGGCQATLELDKNEEDEYIFHFEKTGARLRIVVPIRAGVYPRTRRVLSRKVLRTGQSHVAMPSGD